MKPEEIAAYIGALAWMPQVATWLHRVFTRPKVRFIPAPEAQVGFTNFGPIFNIRMACFVEHGDVIVEDMELSIAHQDGDTRTFRWAGIAENFSEIRDSAGNQQQIVGRDQSPIALKITQVGYTERFVRFQNPDFQRVDKALSDTLLNHFNFLRQTKPETFAEECLKSKEVFDLIGSRQKWPAWKAGHYTVTLSVTSPQRVTFERTTFEFDLSPADIEHLKKNVPMLEHELRNIIGSNIKDFKHTAFTFQWVMPRVTRASAARRSIWWKKAPH